MGTICKKKLIEGYSREYSGVSPVSSSAYRPLSQTSVFHDTVSKYGADEYCNCTGPILNRTKFDMEMLNKYAPMNNYAEPEYPLDLSEGFCYNYELQDNPYNDQAYYSCYLNRNKVQW